MLLLQHGNGVTSKDEIVVSEGWTWTTEWIVDANRAVDEDGNNALKFFQNRFFGVKRPNMTFLMVLYDNNVS